MDLSNKNELRKTCEVVIEKKSLKFPNSRQQKQTCQVQDDNQLSTHDIFVDRVTQLPTGVSHNQLEASSHLKSIKPKLKCQL